MNLFEHLALLAVLVLAAGFLSLSEIALAGARKIKLKLLAEAGDERAHKVIALQAQSADFFAASQIGLNAIAILGGILGEGALRPFFLEWLALFYDGPGRDNLAFALSFVFVTTLFVLFADLMPKRLAMIAQTGFARAIYPVHAPLDGDVVFAAATGEKPIDPLAGLTELGMVAANVMARAIARGVYEASALPFVDALPAWKDRFG